jgi:ion channel-forming bestrophin family protein
MKKIKIKRKSWFRSTFKFRGSVIPAILERSVVCAGFGLLISILYYYKLPVSLPVLGSAIPSVVLGLVLVFRTNTAYDRFWEGRRLWGTLVNAVRNLTWQIWVNIDETTAANGNISVRERKIVALRLLIAFAVAKRKHLRSEPPDSKLASLLSDAQFSVLQKTRNMPLEIARWLGDYLNQEYRQQRLSIYQLTAMQTLVNTLVEGVGGCERILKTPLPLAYSIHIKQLVLLYCLVMPFQFVHELNWWTGPFTALVSFTLFGIEEIGIEIENPFGTDASDLPLEAICNTIEQNIEDFIATESVDLLALSEDEKALS